MKDSAKDTDEGHVKEHAEDSVKLLAEDSTKDDSYVTLVNGYLNAEICDASFSKEFR